PFTSGSPGSPQLLQSIVAAQSYFLDNFRNQIAGAQAIVRGRVVDLPTGPIQSVFGVQVGHEEQTTSELALGVNSDVKRDTYAVFTEERIPLIGNGGRSERGDKLAISLAGRYDHSSDFGGKATWQSALEVRPASSLLLRGGYAVSYKAPELQE